MDHYVSLVGMIGSTISGVALLGYWLRGQFADLKDDLKDHFSEHEKRDEERFSAIELRQMQIQTFLDRDGILTRDRNPVWTKLNGR